MICHKHAIISGAVEILNFTLFFYDFLANQPVVTYVVTINIFAYYLKIKVLRRKGKKISEK